MLITRIRTRLGFNIPCLYINVILMNLFLVIINEKFLISEEIAKMIVITQLLKTIFRSNPELHVGAISEVRTGC